MDEWGNLGHRLFGLCPKGSVGSHGLQSASLQAMTTKIKG